MFILLEIKPHQLLYNMGHYGLVTPENILIVDYGKSTVNNDMKTSALQIPVRIKQNDTKVASQYVVPVSFLLNLNKDLVTEY